MQVCTKRYLDECLLFVRGTSEAVERREKNQVPTLADYFDWRVLNLGFEIYFTLVEYATSFHLAPTNILLEFFSIYLSNAYNC